MYIRIDCAAHSYLCDVRSSLRPSEVMAVGKANYFFLLNITVDIDCLELYEAFYDAATATAAASTAAAVAVAVNNEMCV